MKLIIGFLFLCLVLFSCKKETATTFKVNGQIMNINDSAMVYIQYPIIKDGIWINKKDSSLLIDGHFSFSGNIEDQAIASLRWGGNNISFFLASGNTKFKINNDEPYLYEVFGLEKTKEDVNMQKNLLLNEMQLYETKECLIKTLDLFNTCAEDYPRKDSLINLIGEIQKERKALYKEKKDKYVHFVNGNRNNKIALMMLLELSNPYMSDNNSINADSLDILFNALSENIQSSLMGKFVQQKIETMPNKNTLSEGQAAVPFVREDVNGEIVNLLDYKDSKYILLDFWASWCGPCITEFPTIATLYDQYKQKDLIIIGITCDVDTIAWRNSISKYNLDRWLQINSTSKKVHNAIFDEDISDWYNVKTIPCFFFINKEGVILKRWQHIGQNELDYIKKQMEVNEYYITQSVCNIE